MPAWPRQVAYLPREGKRVLVVEQGNMIGGFCTTEETVPQAPKNNIKQANRILLYSPGAIIEEWFESDELRAAMGVYSVSALASLDVRIRVGHLPPGSLPDRPTASCATRQPGEVLYVHLPTVPYELADTTWDKESPRFLDHRIETLAGYMPGLKHLVLGASATSRPTWNASPNCTEEACPSTRRCPSSAHPGLYDQPDAASGGRRRCR